MQYEFSELQDEILDAVRALDGDNFFGPNRQVTVVPGFLMVPVQQTLGSDIELGASMPIVGVVDNATGQVWQFSLGRLIPRLRLN